MLNNVDTKYVVENQVLSGQTSKMISVFDEISRNYVLQNEFDKMMNFAHLFERFICVQNILNPKLYCCGIICRYGGTAVVFPERPHNRFQCV